jgi:hypothetical protein
MGGLMSQLLWEVALAAAAASSTGSRVIQ